MTAKRWAIALAALCVTTLPVAAETAEEKGLAIARAADAKDSGFTTSTALGKMVLRNRHGQESVRDFRSNILEVADDGDKNVIVFDHPPDIRKTALLTHAHKERNDDQWLFLPALTRVKRISTSNQSGSFVGSEFSYEDMSRQAVEKYTYRWLRDEPCPGVSELTCHVNERDPTNPKSGYEREVVWLDTVEFRVFKIDYYDRKLMLLKTMVASDYKVYEGRYWRPDNVLMTNHQTGKSTTLIWRDYRFGVDLTDLDFTKRALQRGIRAPSPRGDG